MATRILLGQPVLLCFDEVPRFWVADVTGQPISEFRGDMTSAIEDAARHCDAVGDTVLEIAAADELDSAFRSHERIRDRIAGELT